LFGPILLHAHDIEPKKSRKEPSATTLLPPKASAQADAHCATPCTWNSLPRRPGKPPPLPPPYASQNVPSAVFPTRCAINKYKGWRKEGEELMQIPSYFRYYLTNFYFTYCLFVNSVIHKRKKVFGRAR